MTALLVLTLSGIIVGLVIVGLVARLAQRDDAWAPVAVAPEATSGPAPASPDRPGGGLRSVGSPLRVAIVAGTAGLFALAATRYDEPAHLALATAYIAVLVSCASTDLLAYRVPNALTYPAIVLALAAGLAMPDARAADVVAGGALAGGALLIPVLLTRGRGVGLGDVKLALFLGLALGFRLAAAALLVTAILGGLTAAMLLAFGLKRRRDAIPYAPFLSAGALTLLLWRGAAFAGGV